MRAVVLAMPCPESRAAVRAMDEAGLAVTAVIVAQRPPALAGRRLDLSTGPSWLAGRDGVPTIAVARLNAAIVAMEEARPDVIVAACFPWRLPFEMLAPPPLGCLNIHPSLLPRHRGPDPVFWTYRQGDRRTGVTVHLMDAGLDTGPVLIQRDAPVPIGGRAPELEQALMAEGGRLVAKLLPRLATGTITPRPQDERRATAAPLPSAADLEITTSWPAERAFRFAHGVAPSHCPLAVRLDGDVELVAIQDALDYHADESAASLTEEGRDVVRVRFNPGWVRFRRAAATLYPLSLSPSSARDMP